MTTLYADRLDATLAEALDWKEAYRHSAIVVEEYLVTLHPGQVITTETLVNALLGPKELDRGLVRVHTRKRLYKMLAASLTYALAHCGRKGPTQPMSGRLGKGLGKLVRPALWFAPIVRLAQANLDAYLTTKVMARGGRSAEAKVMDFLREGFDAAEAQAPGTGTAWLINRLFNDETEEATNDPETDASEFGSADAA